MNSRGGLVLALTLAYTAAVPAARVFPEESRSDAMPGMDLNNQGVMEARSGHFEQGVSLLRQALLKEPGDVQIRRNLSGILSDWAVQLEQQGQSDRAIQALEEAVKYDPENGKALVVLGNFSYLLRNDLTQAIQFWKQAYGKIPPDQSAALLEKISRAQRDLAIERGFTGLRTAHFHLCFEASGKAPEAAGLGDVLEREYKRLSQAVGAAPPVLTVIVYTDQNFKRVAGSQDWALGLYDGRIRMRLDDLGTERTQPILAHELAHAFLAQAYGPRVPIWIHEGFAQTQEPPTPPTDRQKAVLQEIISRTSWIPLRWIDRRFEQPSGREDLERAYTESRLVVDFLIRSKGMDRFQEFVKKVGSGGPVEQAFDQTFAPLRWSKIEQGILDPF